MKVSFKTDKGIKRQNNEDSLLAILPWNSKAISCKACLFLVADGMGGQNAGEIASGIAVNFTNEWFGQNALGEISTALLDDLTNSANEKIWTYSQSHPETKGMGTTFSSILIKDCRAIIAHIGDSRIYRLRNDELVQLTNDHSIVGEQLRLGKITAEQARVHPARGLLSKVLGARQFIKADIFETEIKVNDEFILCTDGIYSMIENSEIERLIKNTATEDLASTLISAANNAGGKDNSTVIAFKLDELPIGFPSKFSVFRLFKLLSNYFCK